MSNSILRTTPQIPRRPTVPSMFISTPASKRQKTMKNKNIV